MSEEICIWCDKQPGASLEHIAPDALGCPHDFVLTQGVCEDCNHRNGRLDRALLVPFEILTVMKGIPRKKGKKPTVDGFASIASGYDENGPAFYINRESYPVQSPSGKWLKGTNSTDPIRDFEWEQHPDGTVKVSYNQELRFDRMAVRGLFKIAVEAIAYFEGLEAARSPDLKAVKHFVLEGGGNFRAIMMPDQNPAYESYFAPCFTSDDHSRVYAMTLLNLSFMCDFAPSFSRGKMLLAEAKKQAFDAQVVPNWPRKLWIENNRPS